MSIRVLVAEDSGIMREAISRLLRSDPEILVVAEAVGFGQMVQLIESLNPHVVVMDLHMHDETATTTQQVKSSLGGCCLVAISFAHNEETQTLADSFGAEILLDKMSLASELIPAIKQCVKSPD
jgi:two-component system, NarL family, response regulator DesR